MAKKYRLGLTILATLVWGFALAPTALANVVNTLGLTYGTNTGLGSKDIRTSIASIINVALGLLGIVALAGVLYGGFKMMTAGGNEEQAGDGKKAIIAGVIGLVIIFSSYAIANFVLTQLSTATGSFR